jgi:hypothetical protein
MLVRQQCERPLDPNLTQHRRAQHSLEPRQRCDGDLDVACSWERRSSANNMVEQSGAQQVPMQSSTAGGDLISQRAQTLQQKLGHGALIASALVVRG